MVTQIEPSAWRATMLPLGSTIQQAIHSLEKSGMKIVLAVSVENILVGTISDGDIRRAFLKGLELNCIIDQIINISPLVVPPEVNPPLVLRLMQINKIQQLPVVDRDGRVVGLHVWDTLNRSSPRENIMIIIAGGKGTRLLPHTESCPKPMVEIGGKPILEHIIERAKRDGFLNFIISIHHLGDMIESHFGNGDVLGVKITYLREKTPLGTAGSLSLLDLIPDLPIIVTNGDVLTDIHYNEFLDFHIRHDAQGTMAVKQHEIQNQFGVVRTRGVDIDSFEEKPIYRSHVNAGIYVINPGALSLLEYNKRCDMPELFEGIKEKLGRTIVYPMHEPWLDVGQPEELKTAREDWV